MRYWRERRGIPRQTFAELLGRSRSWVEMAETGQRPPYRLDELVRIVTVLRVDLGAFLCDPVPGLVDESHRDVLLMLRDAFANGEPRSRLSHLAQRLAEVNADADDLVLVVLPGGQWKLVNRRDAIKLGAVLAVGLGRPGLNPDQAGELVSSLETREVSRAGVGALRAVIQAYRRLDDEIGSATLRPLVRQHLHVTRNLRPKSDAVAPDLAAANAELSQFAGWLCFDMGDHDAASAYYRAGLRAAEHAGNAAMAAHVLGSMSYLASTTIHPQEGIHSADAAVQRAAKTPSRTLRASLTRMKAHAHAYADEMRACEHALDQAEAELAAAHSADDPDFIYWFDQVALRAYAGIAYVRLGKPQPANDALRRAVAEINPAFVRDKALYLIYQAHALVMAGEIPEACQLGQEAAALLDQASSKRTTKLLKDLHSVQLRPHWSTPAVRELGDQLYSL